MNRAAFYIISLLVLLTACSARYETIYHYNPPPNGGGKACVAKCARTRSSCHKLCFSDKNSCVDRAHYQAKLEYDDYVSRQLVAGNEVIRDLNSFYDPLQCSKPTCNCEKDYQACYKMCGGQVIVNKKCVANCNYR